MNTKMRDTDTDKFEQIEGHTVKVLRALDGLNVRAALHVLAKASMTILTQPDSKPLDEARLPAPRNIIRKRGSLSRIAKDPELQLYIHSIKHETTLAELRRELIDRFGKARTPSRSALHRYIQNAQRFDEK